MFTIARRSTTSVTPPTARGSCIEASKGEGPRLCIKGPSTAVTSGSYQSEGHVSARCARTTAVAASAAASGVTPAAVRTSGVTG